MIDDDIHAAWLDTRAKSSKFEQQSTDVREKTRKRSIPDLARNLRRRSLPKVAGCVSPNPNMLSQ